MYQEAMDMLRDAPDYSHVEESSLQENFQAGLYESLLYETSIGEAIAKKDVFDRDYEIYDKLQSGEFNSNNAKLPNGDPDNNLMAKKYGLKTDEELEKERNTELAFMREMTADIKSRAGTLGKVAGFAGSMNAYLVDPPTALTMFVPVLRAAKAASYLATMTRAAAPSVVAEVGVQALAQPMILDWNQEQGLDYNYKDAGVNALLNVLGVGAVTATVGAVGKGLRKMADDAARVHGRADEIVQEVSNYAEELKHGDQKKNFVEHTREQEAIEKTFEEPVHGAERSAPPEAEQQVAMPHTDLEVVGKDAWRRSDGTYTTVGEVVDEIGGVRVRVQEVLDKCRL